MVASDATREVRAVAAHTPGELAPRARRKRSVWQKGSTRVGAALVLLVVLTALASLVWLPHPAGEQDLNRSLLPPGWLPDGASGFPLGTDLNGRDLLSRIM